MDQYFGATKSEEKAQGGDKPVAPALSSTSAPTEPAMHEAAAGGGGGQPVPEMSASENEVGAAEAVSAREGSPTKRARSVSAEGEKDKDGGTEDKRTYSWLYTVEPKEGGRKQGLTYDELEFCDLAAYVGDHPESVLGVGDEVTFESGTCIITHINTTPAVIGTSDDEDEDAEQAMPGNPTDAEETAEAKTAGGVEGSPAKRARRRSAEERGQLVVHSHGTVDAEDVRVPGADREVDEDSSVPCERCNNLGHTKWTCILKSTPMKARYKGNCPKCNGDVRDKMVVCRGGFIDGGGTSGGTQSWYHEECRIAEHVEECRTQDRIKAETAAKEAKKKLGCRRLEYGEPSQLANQGITETEAGGVVASAAAVVAETADQLAFLEENCHAIVMATAGAGKTHLITQMCRLVSSRGLKVTCLMFNKSAQRELSSRLNVAALEVEVNDSAEHGEGKSCAPAGGRAVSTFHRMGFQTLLAARQAGEKYKMTKDKTTQILQILFPATVGASDGAAARRRRKSPEEVAFAPFVRRIVSLGKKYAAGLSSTGGAGGVGQLRKDLQALAEERELFRKELDLRDVRRKLGRPVWEKLDFCRTAAALHNRAFDCAVQVFDQSVLLVQGRGVAALDELQMSYDFDDMLYAPLYFGLSLASQYQDCDFVFVDEAQDLNAVQRMMVCRAVKTVTGRVVAVGDRMQAINGFAGADYDSMTHLEDALGNVGVKQVSHAMSLPVCRRCPRSHIDIANEVVQQANAIRAEGDESGEGGGGGGDCEDVKCANDAEKGVVERDATFTSHQPRRQLDGSEWDDGSLVGGGGTQGVLCRTNAPLLALQYKLASRGYGVTMRGRAGLCKEILNMVNESEATKIGNLFPSLDVLEMKKRTAEDEEEEANQGEDAAAAAGGGGNPQCAAASNREMRSDLRGCLRVVMSRLKPDQLGDDCSLSALTSKLRALFEQGDRSVTKGEGGRSDAVQLELASVHKAKGSECKTRDVGPIRPGVY